MKSGVIGACADRAADAVGAEVRSAHGVRGAVAGRGRRDYRRAAAPPARRRAPSTVAATSWTRTIAGAALRPRAPRRRRSPPRAAPAPRRPAAGALPQSGEPGQRRLARPADEQRHAEREQRLLAREQLEVVRRRLAEADAGVDDDALARRCPRARGRGDALAQEGGDLGDDVVVDRPRPASIAASPRMCIRQTPHAGCAATSSSAPGARSARDVVDDVGAEVERDAHHLDLGRCRPRPGSRARPPPRAPAGRGRARRRRLTGSAPGRLDSPPMSRMSAPSASSCSQRAIAAPSSTPAPPSENESGVTLTMPITRGRARSIAKRRRLPDRTRAHEKRGRSPVCETRSRASPLRRRPARCPASPAARRRSA